MHDRTTDDNGPGVVGAEVAAGCCGGAGVPHDTAGPLGPLERLRDFVDQEQAKHLFLVDVLDTMRAEAAEDGDGSVQAAAEKYLYRAGEAAGALYKVKVELDTILAGGSL